ncbi:MAG: sugar transferase [Lacipirellulaceae bacterium]
MPHFASWLKRIAPRGDARRLAVADRYLLSDDKFDLAAEAERMRVDRNGSFVSLLAISLAPTKNGPADVARLARWMSSRLRLTDTAGWLRDGRIGVLLPDTSQHGAWTVASDLCELYDAGSDRPDLEVLVYQAKRPADRWPREAGTSPAEGGTATTDSDDSAPFGSDSYCSALPRGYYASPRGAAVLGRESIAAASGGPSNAGPSNAGRSNSGRSFELATRAADHTTNSYGDGVEFDALFARPLPRWKRAIDVVGASLGLLAAGPAIVAAAVAIRATSPGGAFFTQEREGLGGKRFKIYKLRTMRPDAERMKADLREQSEQDGPAFKMRNDPRITTIGRILRKTSIDELPQLLNVLRGEMSLVGPRPLPVEESRACKPWHRRRLHVTPGITCIWQIHGRNIVPFDDWIRMDLQYVRRRSPWLDLKLVLQTGPSLVLPKGQ